MIKEIKEELSKGNTDKALAILNEFTLDDAKVNNQVIGLLSRYNQWKEADINDTNENNIELRKIEKSILDVISQLQSEAQVPENLPKWLLAISDFNIRIQISISISFPAAILTTLGGFYFFAIDQRVPHNLPPIIDEPPEWESILFIGVSLVVLIFIFYLAHMAVMVLTKMKKIIVFIIIALVAIFTSDISLLFIAFGASGLLFFCSCLIFLYIIYISGKIFFTLKANNNKS